MIDVSHVHCLSLPSAPSRFSILSTGLPQDKCVIPLAGNDLTWTKYFVMMCSTCRDLSVMAGSQAEVGSSPLASVHWFSNLLFICASLYVQISVTYLLQFHIFNKPPFSHGLLFLLIP